MLVVNTLCAIHKEISVLTKDYLAEHYLNQKKSMQYIARENNVSYTTVNYYLTKYKIPKRTNGEHRIVDITDKRYGKWKVVGEINLEMKNGRGWKKPRWKCVCECGTVKYVMYQSLVNGFSKQCRKCGYKSMRSKDNILQTHWSKYVRGAKTRNLDFDITREEAFNMLVQQNYECALSGLRICLPASAVDYANSKYTASLDRIDSAKGYHKDNVQWVHKMVNFMKNRLDNITFWAICYSARNNIQKNQLETIEQRIKEIEEPKSLKGFL